MKNKIKSLIILSLGLAIAIFIFIDVSPASALPAENCYTVSNFNTGRCVCTYYQCYYPGSEVWGGSHVPSDGNITRVGEHCSNNSGWSSNIGEWGDLGYCFYM